MITDAIHDYVAGQLSRLWSLPKPQRRARLAELRRGVGHQPGDLPALWGSFLQELPKELWGRETAAGECREPSEAEWAVYLALTLYALHQQGEENVSINEKGCTLGRAVRLLAQRAAVEASIQEALDRLRLLDTTIERLRKDEKQMNYDVTIKTLPERQVASVRQILPCYDREGDLWHIFVRETALLHIQDGDPALCISVYHDGEYKEADVDVEIQKTVKGTYPDTEHVKFKTIPPVTVASATFQGPYRQIGEVNQAVASWVEDNGYAFDGLFFNIYHVSPHETRNPEEFVTEVCYPVRKR